MAQEISKNGKAILTFMLGELSGCSYLYRNIAEGCYEAAIQNHKFAVPMESMEVIVNEFFSIMNNVMCETDNELAV